MYINEDNFVEELHKRFMLTCRRCQSTNVKVDIVKGIDYGGETGYSSGHISIGCNTCGQNDIVMDI